MRRLRAIIFSLSLCAVMAAGAAVAVPASAQTNPSAGDVPASLQLEVPIPISPLEQAVSNTTNGAVSDITQYIARVYNFAIGMVGFVAAVMMIIGGFQYLTSAGDSGKIGAAKKRIVDAIIGMVLALGSYALLNTINPELLNFKPLSGDINKSTIKTNISVLPWCEDLVAKGTQVKRFDYKTGQYYAGSDNNFNADCGSVGQFGDEKNPLFCMFRGDVSPCQPLKNGISIELDIGPLSGQRKVTVPQVCFPQPLYTLDFIKQRMVDFKSGKVSTDDYCSQGGGTRDAQGVLHCDYPDSLTKTTGVLTPPPLAYCANCADLEFYFEPSKFSPNGSFPNPELCSLFETLANEGPFNSSTGKLPKKSLGSELVQYCRYDSDINGCASGIVACKSSGASCGDYDQQPLYYDALHEIDGRVQTTYGWWVQGLDKQGVLASQPAHLQAVCDANPCGYNGSKGCGGTSGTIDKIRTVARAIDSGIVGYQGCVNQ